MTASAWDELRNLVEIVRLKKAHLIETRIANYGVKISRAGSTVRIELEDPA